MDRRRLLSVVSAVALVAVGGLQGASRDGPQRRHRRRSEHGRLRQRVSRAEVRGPESGREGAGGRHRARRRGLAEDLREARRAGQGRHQELGHRRRRGPSADGRHDGQGRSPGQIRGPDRHGQDGFPRRHDERARPAGRRLRHADVPQPDRARLQPRPRQGPAQDLRRSRHLGATEPQAVRLQRHQGRDVRRRFRHGLGRRAHAGCEAAL